MALFLMACSEEELPNDEGQGYLSMGIAVENASTNIIYTKAFERGYLGIQQTLDRGGSKDQA